MLSLFPLFSHLKKKSFRKIVIQWANKMRDEFVWQCSFFIMYWEQSSSIVAHCVFQHSYAYSCTHSSFCWSRQKLCISLIPFSIVQTKRCQSQLNWSRLDHYRVQFYLRWQLRIDQIKCKSIYSCKRIDTIENRIGRTFFFQARCSQFTCHQATNKSTLSI